MIQIHCQMKTFLEKGNKDPNYNSISYSSLWEFECNNRTWQHIICGKCAAGLKNVLTAKRKLGQKQRECTTIQQTLNRVIQQLRCTIGLQPSLIQTSVWWTQKMQGRNPCLENWSPHRCVHLWQEFKGTNQGRMNAMMDTVSISMEAYNDAFDQHSHDTSRKFCRQHRRDYQMEKSIDSCPALIFSSRWDPAFAKYHGLKKKHGRNSVLSFLLQLPKWKKREYWQQKNGLPGMVSTKTEN